MSAVAVKNADCQRDRRDEDDSLIMVITLFPFGSENLGPLVATLAATYPSGPSSVVCTGKAFAVPPREAAGVSGLRSVSSLVHSRAEACDRGVWILDCRLKLCGF
jgi:hypothetical protein